MSKDQAARAVLRIEKPAEVARKETLDQKIAQVLGKAKKPNLTQNERLDLIVEQNQLILELLTEKLNNG